MTEFARSDLAALVPAAAEQWPEELAIIGDSERLTWSDVNRRTRRVAAALVDVGVAVGDRVAVARPKNNQSFEAVHAILRAGAVVVPIDPLAPPAVARQILADADVVALIGDMRTIGPLDPWTSSDSELRCVIATGSGGDDRVLAWDAVVGGEHLDAVALPEVDADGVAYIIYTSGSTGRPKGIVHTHRSGLAYAVNAAASHELSPSDRVAGMSPLHFDMSTFELYAAPLAGSCVVTMSEPLLRFVASFTERSEREGVTIWYTVPFFLRQVTDRGAVDQRDLRRLRLVMYGGEPYPPGALRALMELLPRVEVSNIYGPAEVNECAFHTVDEPPADDEPLPIGRPWNGATVRVVDETGADVALGTPGELLVSATTAMREYWRQPDLTESRLHARADGPPWYATGDIVTQDADGLLWFHGRRDHQVKVRGIRLELEAIESVLTDAPGVAHAVAGPVGPSGDAAHIAAVVVALDELPIDVDAIRQWCVERLPSVAVPHDISVSPGFPATASGKIDRARVRAELSTT